MNIPVLRFPEFKDKWEEKILGDIFKISAGGDINSENVRKTKDEIFKYPIYANAEKDKGFYGFSDIYKIEENVITVAGRGVNIGIAHVRDHKFYPIVRLLVLKPKNSENIYFFEYQINRLNLFKESTGVPQLTAPQVSGYTILYPEIPEQQKIASFLIAVDDKITLLKKKKTLLEKYKKAVMQKILSQEIRFKDENSKEFPRWEEKMLGDLFDITSSKRVFQSEWTKSGVPFYRARDIVKLCNEGHVENYLHISTEMFNEYKEKYGVPQLGDILITGVGTLGKLYVVKENDKFYFKDGNIIWLKSLKDLNSYFIKLLFETRIVQKQIENKASITTVGTYTIDSAKKTKIPFPSLHEQTKIANFLYAVEEKINLVNEQIEKTELWKKGLLQKIFC